MVSKKNAITTFLKIGRSVHPVGRLSQWKSQCPSRRPIVRDIFPLLPNHPFISHSNVNINTNTSRLAGALTIAEHGIPFHHRLERLILIEVAGRATLEAKARGQGNSVLTARTKCSDW